MSIEQDCTVTNSSLTSSNRHESKNDSKSRVTPRMRKLRDYGRLALACIVLSGCAVQPKSSEGYPSSFRDLKSAEDKLELEIEQKYNVSLTADKRTKWDISKLNKISKYLEMLPKRFYSDTEINLFIRPVESLNSGSGCECNDTMDNANAKKIIHIEIGDFPPDDESALIMVTHEAAHRGTEIKKIILDTDPSDVLYTSIWFDQFESTVATNYDSLRQTVYDKIEKDYPTELEFARKNMFQDFKWWIEVGGSELDVYRMLYAVGYLSLSDIRKQDKYPIEFIAVLAENWVRGDKRFNQFVNRFFDKEESAKLRKFTLDFFEGKTYPNN
ncbi:MAG: hypothetical protein M3P33_03850 [bacterium]|nr:hypothetical protein [bacterium]